MLPAGLGGGRPCETACPSLSYPLLSRDHCSQGTAHGLFHKTNADFDCQQNQLSGYLLRKFKNSSGWQKLWVVVTNFCLFFYKSHQVWASTTCAPHPPHLEHTRVRGHPHQ